MHIHTHKTNDLLYVYPILLDEFNEQSFHAICLMVLLEILPIRISSCFHVFMHNRPSLCCFILQMSLMDQHQV